MAPTRFYPPTISCLLSEILTLLASRFCQPNRNPRRYARHTISAHILLEMLHKDNGDTCVTFPRISHCRLGQCDW
jgi:hypothetical protein